MKFTPRELLIIHCRCELRLSRKETAARLGVKETSLRKELWAMFRRMGLYQQSDFAHICYRYGRVRQLEDTTGEKIVPAWEG